MQSKIWPSSMLWTWSLACWGRPSGALKRPGALPSGLDLSYLARRRPSRKLFGPFETFHSVDLFNLVLQIDQLLRRDRARAQGGVDLNVPRPLKHCQRSRSLDRTQREGEVNRGLPETHQVTTSGASTCAGAPFGRRVEVAVHDAQLAPGVPQHARVGLVEKVPALGGILEREQDAAADGLAELLMPAIEPLLARLGDEDVGRVHADKDQVAHVGRLGCVDGEDLLDRVKREEKLLVVPRFEDDGQPPVLRVDLHPPLLADRLAPLERVRPARAPHDTIHHIKSAHRSRPHTPLGSFATEPEVEPTLPHRSFQALSCPRPTPGSDRERLRPASGRPYSPRVGSRAGRRRRRVGPAGPGSTMQLEPVGPVIGLRTLGGGRPSVEAGDGDGKLGGGEPGRAEGEGIGGGRAVGGWADRGADGS